MRNLMHADLKRIICKPGIYTLVLLLLLVIILKKPEDTAAQQINLYKFLFYEIGMTFICVPIFLSVYSDELKNKTLVIAIGMGLSRRKIVIAKLCNCTLLLLGSYMILYAGAFIKMTVSRLAVTSGQNIYFFIFCLFCVLRAVGVFALSSLVLYSTLSSAGGMLTMLICTIASTPFLKVLQGRTALPLYDMSYMGLLDRSFAGLRAGELSGSLLLALVYLLIVIEVNVLIFNRKEMNL